VKLIEVAQGAAVRALACLCVLVGCARIFGAEQGTASPAPKSQSPFPDVNQVLQGRGFESAEEREVFFLRKIRESYPQHWPALLQTNIIVQDYVAAPDKLLRFIQKVGKVCAETDDQIASTNLAVIVSNPTFYANTNAYRPSLLQEAAWVLLRIGPSGRRALGDAFNVTHYRQDPPSLEVLANAIGRTGSADTNLSHALARTIFEFTSANGGFFPHCTSVCVTNLLRLPGGMEALAPHLVPEALLNDPGRFQTVLSALPASSVSPIASQVEALSRSVTDKLQTLTNSPGEYRDELKALQSSIQILLKK